MIREKGQKHIQHIKKTFREHRVKAAVYFVLRFLVIVTMIAQFFNGDYNNVFMCILTLILFMIPTFIERQLKVDLPNTLEIIILLFIFSAEILGEIQEYYLIFEEWDTILHTLNGFLMAAIGFSMVDILNRSEKFTILLSPFFLAMVAFCFSMTVGVVWEFYEYGMDVYFGSDMQKDTIIQTINSVLFQPEGRNEAVALTVESIVVNGETWNFGGYIDIGLIDTMMDLFVNFIGAFVFSIIGFFYVKGRGKFASRFIPTLQSKNKFDRK